MEPKCSLLFVLLLVYTDISYSDAHASVCEGQSNNVLKLQEGTTYVYNLDALTETSVPRSSGPNGDSTKLGLKAKVEVNVQAKCAALIRLRNVQIIGPDDKKHGSLSKLEANPLRISLNGGRLHSRVDVVKDDDYTSLNIKRAVASLLQISAADSGYLQEIDVFGACPTTYSVGQQGDTTVYSKSRNLNECAYRENIRHEIFAVPGSGNSLLQSIPLLDPKYHAEIRVKDGVVESAVAHEEYLLRPFSDSSNGAKTKVTTKLTLASKGAGSVKDTTSEDRSIIFENPHETISASIQSVLAALHKVADKTVGEDAARNVAELVAIIRRASAEDLLSVYGQVKAGAGFQNKNLAKKAFSDALFRSGSGDSIAVAAELLKSRQITGDEAKLWYLSFAFARHVSSTALEKAANLLDDSSLPKEAYLGVGALAGKYCREHQCDSSPALQNLVNKLASPLTKSPTSRSEESKVVGSLKSLRNVKYLTDEVANKVANLIKDAKASTRVRAAALDAAVSDACKKKLQKAAADVLNNIQEDSELRIKGYLVLVECPSAQTANKLSEFIEKEPVNQVGAFITSHLRNLRATARPERQAAKALLENVRPRKHFPFDIRKFSQNYELSYDIDALGASASLDSNVIFSQKSYIPRSANLNLTAEFFGHAFNLFEINGRAENLDRVVERFLGPKSYLRNAKTEDLIKDGKSRAEALSALIENKYRKISRTRRSVSRDEINKFGEKVRLYNNELDKNVDVDLSLRFLGNELLWLNLGEKDSVTPEELIQKVSSILERGLGDAKNFEQNIQNHAVFLDTELAYPTASGLAVKVSATGTSVVHLKVAGSADVAALLKNFANGEAKVEVRPSASVEVVGQLSVDGYAVETGIKLAGNLHTETGTEISVKLLDGEGIDINIGLPIKDSDILTVNTEVLVAVRERGQPQTTTQLNFQVPRTDYQACFDQLMPVIGLTLCGKVGFPRDPTGIGAGAAAYPLNGHSKFSVHLNKEDESLTNYHFRLQYSLKDPTNRRIQALVETPGSKNPREISLLAEAKTVPNKEINVALVTPIYKFRTQAVITETSSEYSIAGLAELEGVFSYKAKLGLLINGATYTPVLEYTLPDGQNAVVNVEGTVTVEKAGPARRTYTFNNIRFASPSGDITINGPLTRDTNLFKTDLKIGYGSEKVGIKTKFEREGDSKLKIVIEISPSQYPDFGIGVKYEARRTSKLIENSLIVTHGPDLSATNPRLSIYHLSSLDTRANPFSFDVSTKNTLTYPLFGIEAKLDASATPKGGKYDLVLGYEDKKISSELDLKINTIKPGDYDAKFKAYAFGQGVALESKRDIVAPNKSKFTNQLTISPGGKYNLDAEVRHQLDKNNVDVDFDATLRIEGVSDAYRLDVGTIFNPKTLEAHSRIIIGERKLVIAEVEHQRVDPISGRFKFNVDGAIESNGEYKRSGSKATANLLIKLIPISRTIKGSADLSANGPKHQGTIEILYDAEKDPSKKVVIQTDTDLTTKSINSKNKVAVNGDEAVINFNGEVSGALGKGGVSGGYDITLPCGAHLVARGKQALNIVPNDASGELFLEFGYSPQKGEQLTKITLDTSAKHVDVKRYSFESKFELAYVCPHGDAYVKQSIKSIPNEGKYLIEAQNSIGGSHLGSFQYNGKLKGTVSKTELSYHTTASLGQKFSFDANGKASGGIDDKAKSFEQTVVIKTGLDAAKDIKISTNLRYVIGDGSSPCQLKLGQELILDGKTYKVSLDGKGTKKDGELKGSATVGSGAPFSGAVRYKYNHDEIRHGEVSLEGSHGSDVVSLNVKADYTQSLTLIKAQIVGSTPLEKAKKFDFNINYKRVSTVSGNADAQLSLNDDKLDFGLKYDLTPNHWLVDASSVVNGAKYRYLIKADKKSDRSGSAEGQVVIANKVNDWAWSAELESLENFLITLKLHGELYRANKLRVEFGNRPTKGGAANRVNINVQTKDGKILTGSASYAVKDTDVGYSVEGKGQVTYENTQYPLTYKISNIRLSKNVNNEVGRETVVQFESGKINYKYQNKISDKEILYDNTLCIKGECDIVLLNYQYPHSSANGELTSEIQAKLSSKIFTDGDYTAELHGKQRNRGIEGDSETVLSLLGNKYSLKTRFGASKQGYDDEIILTVPTRELALVTNYRIDDLTKSTNSFAIGADISLYLDRQKNPKDKATLSLDGILKLDKDRASASASAKFNHPSLSRELSVKGEGSVDIPKVSAKAILEVDVLSKKSQKITMTAAVEPISLGDVDLGALGKVSARNFTARASLVSKGLVLDLGALAYSTVDSSGFSHGASAYYIDDKNIRKQALAAIALTREQFLLELAIPGHEIISAKSQLSINGDTKSVLGELTIAGGETAVLKASLVGLHELKASLSPKSNPGRSLEGLLSFTAEKLEVRAERVQDGARGVLFFGVVNLDQQNMLKIDYDAQLENVKKTIDYFLNTVLKDISDRFEKIADSFSKEIKSEYQNLVEAMKKAIPNFKNLIQQYEAVFKAIREEIEKDKNFQLLSSVFKKLLGAPLDAIEAQIRIFLKTLEKLAKEVVEIQEKIFNVVYEKIIPELREAYQELRKSAVKLVEKLIEIGTKLSEDLLKIARQHEKEVRALIDNFTKSFRDIGRITMNNIHQLRNELRDLLQLILEQIRELPIVDIVRERLRELSEIEPPEHFWELLEELRANLVELMPVPEQVELINTVFADVKKWIKEKKVPVDDLIDIGKKLTAAVKAAYENLLKNSSFLKELTEKGQDTWSKLPNLAVKLPAFATNVLRLPQLGNIRFSPIGLLSSLSELPSPLEIYFTYRPTYNPLDQIPPYRAYGIILNSHHVFTFDKTHYMLKGSCSYVLTQDFLDGNFSVVANLESGKIKSLTVTDKNDVVELLADTTVIVNGKPGEFPVVTDEISGWRRYSTVNLKTKSGVFIKKYVSQDIFVVQVSGFYFGRTRGLLGTISNEQYDEFTLPNGQVANNENEFTNAYALSTCAPVAAHSHAAAAASGDCSNFFSSTSTLRNYFGFLNPTPYREACTAHGAMMPGNERKAACDVVAAYVVGLRQEGTLFPSVPPECAQCNVAGKQLELGQTEQLKRPEGKADVVIVFEQSTFNEAVFKDLITPLISTLSKDLQGKGLSDVEYALIGYGAPGQRWPQHYGNNGKVTYQGKSDNIKFGDTEKLSPPYDSLLKRVKLVQRFIEIELGQEQIVIAMNEANKYPFRQGAARTIILINSTPCSRSPIFPLSLQIPRVININRYYKEHGLAFFIVSPLPLADSTIVGFSREGVYYLDKEASSGGSDALEYDTDLCLEFSQYYGGAAFSSQNLVKASPDQKKKFVDIVSQKITAGTVRHSYTDDCVCTLKSGFIPVTHCTVSSRVP